MGQVTYLNNFIEEKKFLVNLIICSLKRNNFYSAGPDKKIIFDNNINFYPNNLKIFHPSKFSLVLGEYVIGKKMINIADLLFDDRQTNSNFYHKWTLKISDFNKNVSRLCGLMVQIADEHRVKLGFYSKIDNSPLSLTGVLDLKEE